MRNHELEAAELRKCLTECLTDRLRLYIALQRIADAQGARATMLRKIARDATNG